MAEELALEERLGQRGAVDRDEGPAGAVALRVQRRAARPLPVPVSPSTSTGTSERATRSMTSRAWRIARAHGDDARGRGAVAEDGAQRGHLPAHAALVDRAVEEERELLELEGLGEVVASRRWRIDSIAESIAPYAVITMTGSPGAIRRAAESSARPSTPGMRRSVTSAAKGSARQPRDRLLARRDGRRVVAAIAQPVGDGLRHLDRVVDDEDARGLLLRLRHGCPPSGSGRARSRRCRGATRA